MDLKIRKSTPRKVLVIDDPHVKIIFTKNPDDVVLKKAGSEKVWKVSTGTFGGGLCLVGKEST